MGYVRLQTRRFRDPGLGCQVQVVNYYKPKEPLKSREFQKLRGRNVNAQLEDFSGTCIALPRLFLQQFLRQSKAYDWNCVLLTRDKSVLPCIVQSSYRHIWVEIEKFST